MPEYLTDGATSFDPSSWESGNGFIANAELVVSNQTQRFVSGFDQSTNGIDYLHILGGSPKVTGSNILDIKFEASPSAEYPLVIDTSGGQINLEIDATNDCPVGLFRGTDITVYDGEFGDRLVVESGTVMLNESVTFGASAELIVKGGRVISKSTDTIPVLRMTGGYLETESVITTGHVGGGTVVTNVTSTANAMTTLNLYGGTVRMKAGTIPTINQYAGDVVTAQAVRALGAGGTAYLYLGRGQAAKSTGLVTVGSPTAGYGANWGAEIQAEAG